jgi:predicted amidohydrolase
MPTWAEKLVSGQGDASDLRPVKTPLGQIGVLICGENTTPLTRYTLVAQGEQVHISTYPPIWPFRREGPPNYARWVEMRTVAHAFEAKVVSLTAAGHLDETTINEVAASEDRAREALCSSSAAMSLIDGPGGEVIGDPLSGREGPLVASIDLGESVIPKSAHDIVGHYQRLDLFSLTVDQRPQRPIQLIGPAHGDEGPGVFDNLGSGSRPTQTDEVLAQAFAQ